MTKKKYKNLIEHLRNWIIGLPNSKYLLPLLELRFTPEEAEFLSRVPFLPHTIEELSERLNISIEELKEKLNDFACRGIIFRAEGRTAVRYALRDSLFMIYRMPGWKGENDELNRKLAPLLNQYYTEVYGEEFLGHPTQGLRAIPINQTIKDPSTIMPYEDIVKVIDNFKYFTVATCACRLRKNLDPTFGTKYCEHETSNCLHFDLLGKYKIQNGIGREITKEETLEILKKAADAGLVHGVSNTMEKMDTICNCCSCCCLFLEKLAQFPEIVGHQRSNYIRDIDNEKCIGCGLCVKRCPMKALELEDKKVVFKPDLCIGCGVCVHKCPEEAIFLIKRDEEQTFPKDPREQVYLFLKERGHDPAEIFRKNS